MSPILNPLRTALGESRNHKEITGSKENTQNKTTMLERAHGTRERTHSHLGFVDIGLQSDEVSMTGGMTVF